MNRALLTASVAVVSLAAVACTSSGGASPGTSGSGTSGTSGSGTPSTSAGTPSSSAPTPTPPTPSETPLKTVTPTRRPSPAASTPKPTPQAAAACTAAQLRVSAVVGGAVQGREIAGLIFTNVSYRRCTLRGYAFAQLRYRGAPLDGVATHNRGTVRTVLLRPGDAAAAQLTAVTTCQAPISDRARVRAPGATTSTSVAVELRGCSLSIDPLEPA